jgi:RNA-directed DNA polymerase
VEEWVERDVQPRMTGRCLLMRFADAVVMGGELEADARTSMAVVPKRCARFGRRIPPTKTALMACRQPEAHQGSDTGRVPEPC